MAKGYYRPITHISNFFNPRSALGRPSTIRTPAVASSVPELGQRRKLSEKRE